MSKYNIINKYPKGNKYNQIYEISYQIDNKPEVYKLKMVYIRAGEENKYVFLDLDRYPHIGIMNNKDRDLFIEELHNFQKGGSYRKTHPILYSKIDLLQQRKKQLMKDVGAIECEIRNIKEEEWKQKVKNLKDKVDLKSIEDELKIIDDMFTDTNYELIHDGHSFNDYTFLFIDKSVGLPIIRIKIHNGKTTFDHLSDNDVIQYLK